MNQWEAMDKEYVWHPFTQMQGWNENKQLVIDRGEGVMLYDTEGKAYYDGISSLWVNIHGHRRREIDEAVKKQLDKIAHSTLLGLINKPSAELAQKLVEVTPDGLNKVFYSDDGSTAVEAAVKIAFQYWQHKGRPEKQQFINPMHSGICMNKIAVPKHKQSAINIAVLILHRQLLRSIV